MKANRITLIISSAVFITAWLARQALLNLFSTHGGYYVTAILVISGIITVITFFRSVRTGRQWSISADAADRALSEQPRQHYRMQFDQPPHPLFIESTDIRHPITAFTCPVRDVSETGISLGCRGVYALGQTVQGEIIFDSGRTAPINGVVIRETSDRTCLRLHCTIDPPLLMAEQREQITMEKGNTPRPAVSKSALDKSAGPLPSHSPKGICRLKRM